MLLEAGYARAGFDGLVGCSRHPCARCACEGQFGTRRRILWRRAAHIAQFFFPLAHNSLAFDAHPVGAHPFDWEQAELLWPAHASVAHDTVGHARAHFQPFLFDAHDTSGQQDDGAAHDALAFDADLHAHKSQPSDYPQQVHQQHGTLAHRYQLDSHADERPFRNLHASHQYDERPLHAGVPRAALRQRQHT